MGGVRVLDEECTVKQVACSARFVGGEVATLCGHGGMGGLRQPPRAQDGRDRCSHRAGQVVRGHGTRKGRH
eukprot:11185354-Lingulodinium_polyedra.AAC.1